MTSIDLANLFIFFGVGFLCLSLIIYLIYQNTLRHKEDLGLTAFEAYFCRTEAVSWLITGATAIIAIILATVLTNMWVTASGFIYATLYFTRTLWYKSRQKNEPARTYINEKSSVLADR
jgi:hypothetical protein